MGILDNGDIKPTLGDITVNNGDKIKLEKFYYLSQKSSTTITRLGGDYKNDDIIFAQRDLLLILKVISSSE